MCMHLLLLANQCQFLGTRQLLDTRFLAQRRTPGGKSFLIKKPPLAVFASYLIRLRVKDEVLSEYLYLYFQSGDALQTSFPSRARFQNR